MTILLLHQNLGKTNRVEQWGRRMREQEEEETVAEMPQKICSQLQTVNYYSEILLVVPLQSLRY